MELFESTEQDKTKTLTRVPGGWILNQFFGLNVTSTFIPFSKDFQTKEKKEPVQKKGKPTMLEIIQYFEDRECSDSEARNFFNFYESNGWKVGKNPMVNWRSAASNWISRNAPSMVEEPIDFTI